MYFEFVRSLLFSHCQLVRNLFIVSRNDIQIDGHSYELVPLSIYIVLIPLMLLFFIVGVWRLALALVVFGIVCNFGVLF